MQNQTDARLDRIRGAAPPKRHNARTIAALTRNPGCARRAVLDAAGVDKDGLARRVGFSAGFGQSRFAITRGNAFEAQVKTDGCAELLRLLRETLGLSTYAADYADLEPVTGDPDEVDAAEEYRAGDAGEYASPEARHSRTRSLLFDAVESTDAATFFDHPLLCMSVGGQEVYLEPDLVAFQHDGVFHVVEIKSFPVIDGQADGEKVAAAAIQAAVYVLALRRMLGRPEAVSHDVVLVCPRDFSNVPTATMVDVRRQLIVLEHQLARLTRVDALVEALPPTLTFDLATDAGGIPTRSAGELAAALGQLPARYTPACLRTCEMAFHCRHEAAGRTATLGVSVREDLGGVETVAEALYLADGALPAGEDQAEAAVLLRTTARMYAEALAGCATA